MIPASECPGFDLKAPPDLAENQLPQRKHPRLRDYDYSQAGAYFITICTLHKAKILSRIIVGRDAHIPPSLELSQVGRVAEHYIQRINQMYENVWVDHYVIMPDHIHLLNCIDGDADNGGMWASRPTIQTIVRSLKTLVTKQIGRSIWQASFYDHIIRSEKAYQEIWQYIENNPAQWEEDHCS